MIATTSNTIKSGRFQLPSGACDTHCHVFGPAARFPYAPSRRYDPADSPREMLAALHAGLGIDRAVIVQASAHGTDNRAMLDALRWRPSAYRGIAVIDDDIDDVELRDMHEAGVRGVRFNFVKSLGGHPNMSVFSRVVMRVTQLGWHVVLHVQGDDLLALAPTIRALPLPFVIDHMGRVDVTEGTDGAAFRTLLALLELNGAWVKVSGAERMCAFPYEAALPFARALITARPERILWGTDFPHPNLRDPVDERVLLDLIPRYASDTAVQHQILVANPARLYGFPDA